MSFRTTMRNKWTWIIGVPVLLVVIFVGGPFVYINFIKDDAPPPLKLESVDKNKNDDAPRRPRRRPGRSTGSGR